MNQTQNSNSVGFSHLAAGLAAVGKWPDSGNVTVLQVVLLIAYVIHINQNNPNNIVLGNISLMMRVNELGARVRPNTRNLI